MTRAGSAAVVALMTMLALAGGSQAATSIGLGTADSFAVLAGAGVTNSGPSVINGDLGTSPTAAVSGFGGAPNGTVNGSVHQADAAAAGAQADLTSAYNNAAGQGPASTVGTELGGQTLTPGVYDSQSGTFGITGTVTLDAQGDPNAAFIFKTGTTLISATASQVNLINGAQPCQVFWKVGSSATLGTDSAFAGNILASESISLNSGVTVAGRLLARSGAVTLINDTITRADCATGGGGSGGGGNDGGGNGGGGGGGGNGGGGGGNDGGGNDGGGNDGGGNDGGGAGPGAGPTAHIGEVPHHGDSSTERCVSTGFRARIDVRGKAKVRSVEVFLDGKRIARSSMAHFSIWIKVNPLRAGRNTIRVVATDVDGRRDASSRRFRTCDEATPEPGFTGRAAATP